MRLFLLPISTRRTLIYCERVNKKLPPGEKPPIVDRVTGKANETWAEWEKAEKGWKKMLTEYGNKVFTRIPFAEWGLKTIPPISAERQAAALAGKETPEVVFPGAFLPSNRVTSVLHKLATERQALHRKRMWWSVVGMPISVPFALVPIVPNIPFFYLAFRAWSHYRALYGSQYLEFLVDKKLIKPTPSTSLDELYTAGLTYTTRAESREAPMPTEEHTAKVSKTFATAHGEGSEEFMLLRRWNGKLLAEHFKLPEMEIEIERAVEQVEKALEADRALQQEKRALDKATAQPPQQKQD
ncbi:mitochondrial K+-H+ exchange-related-domain-containing protein [Cryomyces antarcticus]|nr:hypothetical protein LTR04_006606 [Oleoguttula sp. CCFEE 6159]